MNNTPAHTKHNDDMQHMFGVYQTVVKHFLHKELTDAQLVDLTGYQAKRPTWGIKALTTLAEEYGLSVKMIEPFNYKCFASEGEEYLYDLYDNEEVAWYANNTNTADIKPYITKFLATVRPECRRATLEDIDSMLDEGRIVSVTTSSHTLPDNEGFEKRTTLITGRTGGEYHIRDLGSSSQAESNIGRSTLWEVMGGESNTAEVVGFMLRKAGLRLDQYVIREKPTLSRAYATRLIAEERILVNGHPNKPGYKLRDADSITIDYDEADEPLVPDIDLPVLYEDDDCIVINKPSGVLTHNKGVRFIEATVASFVRSRAKLIGGERPGIVHRLDRATSGVIICAKTPQALSWLQKQFHDRTVIKTYTAIIQGALEPEEAIIDMPIERNPKAPASFRVGINGKTAQTYYKTEQTSPDGTYSMLELRPKTGRTHQLRVHLAHRHHPIVGDTLYDGEPADRLYLHAHKLEITLPNGQTKKFEAPLPPEFHNKLIR